LHTVLHGEALAKNSIDRKERLIHRDVQGAREVATDQIALGRRDPEGGVKVSEERVERGGSIRLGVLGGRNKGTFRDLSKHLALETRLTIAFSDRQGYVIGRIRSRL